MRQLSAILIQLAELFNSLLLEAADYATDGCLQGISIAYGIRSTSPSFINALIRSEQDGHTPQDLVTPSKLHSGL